ncbi:MAG: helix-turn-helix domain-containing protein [Pseudomonadota bacterium]
MRCRECEAEMTEIRGDYLYDGAGVEVLLKNIPVYECPNGHRLPAIPNIRGLHEAMAEWLLEKPGRLSGAEVKFLRKHMRLKSAELAALLGISKQRMSQLENGVATPSKQTTRLVRAIYALRVIDLGENAERAARVAKKALPHATESPRRDQSLRVTPEGDWELNAA